MKKEDKVRLLKRAALYARLHGERSPGNIGGESLALEDARELEALARRMETAPDKTVTIRPSWTSSDGMLDFEMPEGATSVMLLWNDGKGLRGTWISLRHQIYVDHIRELLEAHPCMLHVVIAPLHNSEFIKVWDYKEGWLVEDPEAFLEEEDVKS